MKIANESFLISFFVLQDCSDNCKTLLRFFFDVYEKISNLKLFAGGPNGWKA